jgi:hypothetical protein
VNRVVTGHIDFLSIDIDGNDYAVWEALMARPRVVCIEVGDERGVPVGPMTALAKGYDLVAMSASKVNAFYVAREAF